MNPNLNFLAFACSLVLCTAASAYGENGAIPAKAPHEYRSSRAITELAARYDALQEVSGAEHRENRALAQQLLAVLDTTLTSFAAAGSDALPAEDLNRIARLHAALGNELAQLEGYQTRREEIERILVRPETPPFDFKVGVNGFLRGDVSGNFQLSDSSFIPGHGEGRFVYRVKPYAYWHPAEWLDIHGEGQGYGYTGGHGQEFNKASLYQGFVEAKLPGRDWLALKGGRQEFVYGSTFILGSDSFFDGLTFDGGRLRVKPSEALVIDILGGAYATPFSDGVKGALAGGYVTHTFSEGTALEAYMFHDAGAPDWHSGDYLNIWGLRGTVGMGPVTLEFEPVYESGRLAHAGTGERETVSAYGGHLDLNADIPLADIHNHFFLSYALGSGDRDAANGTSFRKEFRNPNNDTSLVGDMSVVGDLSGLTVNGHHASGLQISTLGWGVDITKELNFSATGRYFRANSVEAGFSRNLGLETDFTLTWNVSEGLSFIAGYDRFFTGGFFRDASGSGKDIDYGYLMVQFDLSKSTHRLHPVKR